MVLFGTMTGSVIPPGSTCGICDIPDAADPLSCGLVVSDASAGAANAGSDSLPEDMICTAGP